MVVTKILRNLTRRFTNIVSSIVEAKNLNTLTVDELCGLLKSHESILNENKDQDEDKALHTKSMPFRDQNYKGERGCGRNGFYRDRGRGRGRGKSTGFTHPIENKQSKGVQCFICKKFGHMKAQCWYKDKEANVAEEAKKK